MPSGTATAGLWDFAGLGDSINQNSADINGPNERDRLSWHTQSCHTAVPTSIQFDETILGVIFDTNTAHGKMASSAVTVGLGVVSTWRDAPTPKKACLIAGRSRTM